MKRVKEMYANTAVKSTFCASDSAERISISCFNRVFGRKISAAIRPIDVSRTPIASAWNTVNLRLLWQIVFWQDNIQAALQGVSLKANSVHEDNESMHLRTHLPVSCWLRLCQFGLKRRRSNSSSVGAYTALIFAVVRAEASNERIASAL